MNTLENTITKVEKPIPLRLVFILNALMAILPFIFYFVLSSKNVSLDGIELNWILYTGFAYILSFATLVYSILNKKIKLFRSILLINFLIAIPSKAYLGMIVSVISLLLSLNKKIMYYFSH